MGVTSPRPRAYLRHPTDIPIRIKVMAVAEQRHAPLKDVCIGGLACRIEYALEIGTPVNVCIDCVSPPFEAAGRVVWCRQCDGRHELGIQFMQEEDAYAARMVEQICHIEHYRNEVLRREGRLLDGHSAATEWIGKYAADFPSFQPPAGD
ncbi:PilZ domain-containing protein [Uliginosibacterium sediminicola]|uniref:PilZ domain-containing protein n=1 Tax=Uliginosibacterium sediminicola TaxID=2024550 RepID=A0ABU9Z155_9RHOO